MLLRAGEVISDLDVARRRRPTARRDHELARGPARLASLLGLTRELNGVDVTDPASPVRVLAGPPVPAAQVRTGPRVGVAAAHDLPWRFWIDGSPAVSPYRPGRRRRPGGVIAAPGHPVPESAGRVGEDRGVGTDILDELEWRGLIAQSTDRAALQRDLDAGVLTLYCGFDPTAPSLHAGNLVPLLTLRRFQRAGARPIVLAGGATGMIGDPRDTGERTLNTAETVAEWGARIRGQLERFVEFDDSPTGALVANNLDWTGGQSVLEFLRDVGKHFSVNVMLGRETVKRRLAADGMSYTEFSYLLLQSQDYLHLFREHGCRLQIGGSDQWGNIVGGVELVRRVTGEVGARADHPAGHRQRGPQVRQVHRRRQHLARPGHDLAVRLVPVLRERGRRRRRPLPAVVHVPVPGGDRGAGEGDRRAPARAGRPTPAGRRADHAGARRRTTPSR